jgi:hypothetical protein
MAESKEPLSSKLVVAVVQTLIFGALLAALGTWLDYQLEVQKQALSAQADRTKALIASLEPDIQKRRTAYLDFQQAARQARSVLDVYYFRATSPPEYVRRRQELRSLENALGVGSGGGRSEWASHRDAIDAVSRLIDLRDSAQDVLSTEVNAEMDQFIGTLMNDMRDGARKSNDNEAFHNAARTRLREAFERLNEQISTALGRDQMPLS